MKAIKVMILKGRYRMNKKDKLKRTARGKCVFAKQTKTPSNGEVLKQTIDGTIHMVVFGPF